MIPVDLSSSPESRVVSWLYSSRINPLSLFDLRRFFSFPFTLLPFSFSLSVLHPICSTKPYKSVSLEFTGDKADDIQIKIKMKRGSSEIESSSPVSSDSADFKPEITPPPSSFSKTKTTKPKEREPPSTPIPKKKIKKEVGQNGEWTPQKKAGFMDRIIATGYKASNIAELAIEVSTP
jgi:hypothetical protein